MALFYSSKDGTVNIDMLVLDERKHLDLLGNYPWRGHRASGLGSWVMHGSCARTGTGWFVKIGRAMPAGGMELLHKTAPKSVPARAPVGPNLMRVPSRLWRLIKPSQAFNDRQPLARSAPAHMDLESMTPNDFTGDVYLGAWVQLRSALVRAALAKGAAPTPLAGPKHQGQAPTCKALVSWRIWIAGLRQGG